MAPRIHGTREGDGWRVRLGIALVVVTRGRLVNHWAADHTNLLGGAVPVLVLDRYEHACHMDFGAKAGAYVDAFMANVQWDEVYLRHGAAIAADALAFGAEPAGAKANLSQVIEVRRAEDYAAADPMAEGEAWRSPASLGNWSRDLDPGEPYSAVA